MVASTVGPRVFVITHGTPPFAPTVGPRLFAITHGIPPATRTVGNGVFAVTNGMKLGCPCRFLPWVFAFSPLPTVQNRCQVHRPYRGFLRFWPYPRYAASRAYRGFSHFRHYPRYKIALRHTDRTVGFCIFAITHGVPSVAPTVGFCTFAVTHGTKLLSGPLTVPWVFIFLLLPTVCRRSRVPWVIAFWLLPTV